MFVHVLVLVRVRAHVHAHVHAHDRVRMHVRVHVRVLVHVRLRVCHIVGVQTTYPLFLFLLIRPCAHITHTPMRSHASYHYFLKRGKVVSIFSHETGCFCYLTCPFLQHFYVWTQQHCLVFSSRSLLLLC